MSRQYHAGNGTDGMYNTPNGVASKRKEQFEGAPQAEGQQLQAHSYEGLQSPHISIFDNKLFRADRSSSKRHGGSSSTGPHAMKSLATLEQPAIQEPSQDTEALTFRVDQLTSQLVAEVEARQAVEEEAWVLERQLLTWQEATQSAKLQVQSLQAQRDKMVRENQILQESLAEAAHEKQQLEAQLRQALTDVGRLNQQGSMSVDSAEHEVEKLAGAGGAVRKLGPAKIKAGGQDSSSRQSPYDSDVESLDRLTSLNAENDDLAQRLLEKQLELAKMKEQQEEEQRARYILESVNLQLAKKVERLTELIADMRTGMC